MKKVTQQKPNVKYLLKYSALIDQFVIRTTRLGSMYVLINVTFKNYHESIVVENDENLDTGYFSLINRLIEKIVTRLKNGIQPGDSKSLHWKDLKAKIEFDELDQTSNGGGFLLKCLKEGKVYFKPE